LATLTVASVMVGSWWFVGGEGMSRLDEVIVTRFGQPI
jgi:hypothetical protein